MRSSRSDLAAAAFAAVVGAAFLTGVGLIACARITWAVVQPASVDTLHPAERSLLIIAVLAAAVGLLLGGLRPWSRQAAYAGIITAASGAVTFATVGLVGGAQQCPSGGECDIDIAPAALESAFAVWVSVAAAVTLGFLVVFLARFAVARRATNP